MFPRCLHSSSRRQPDFPCGFPGQRQRVQDCRSWTPPNVTATSVFTYHIVFRAHNGEKRAPLSTWWPFENACLPCPILQRGFYFLACLEKQAGLLSSGVFSKPLAVTFSLLMLLGQRCEGVGGASLVPVGPAPCAASWAVSASPRSSTDVSLKGCCRLGLCHEAAFLALQGLLKCCFPMKGNPIIDVLLIKRRFGLLEKSSSFAHLGKACSV